MGGSRGGLFRGGAIAGEEGGADKNWNIRRSSIVRKYYQVVIFHINTMCIVHVYRHKTVRMSYTGHLVRFTLGAAVEDSFPILDQGSQIS